MGEWREARHLLHSGTEQPWVVNSPAGSKKRQPIRPRNRNRWPITVRRSIFEGVPSWNIIVPLIILSLMKATLLSMAVLLFLLAGPALVVAMGTVTLGGHWSTASRQSSHQAPDPTTTPEAIVQVYAARAFSWRGAFGIHPWFAVKPAGATSYTVYEKIGWRAMRGLP